MAKKFDVEKIGDIMGKHGFIRILLNKLPTWINEKSKEGLQINEKNEIVTFLAEKGERILTHPDSIEMQGIKREIQLSNEPIKQPEPPKPPEPTKEAPKQTEVIPTETKLVNQLAKVFAGERIIVPQDIQELQAMPVMDRLLLFQKTDKKFVRKRKGFLLPTSARKAKESLTDSDYRWFTYVPANIMKMEANLAFGLLWSAVVESEHYFTDEVAVRGYIRVHINGTEVRRPCGGSCIKKVLMDWGDTLEAAISEMTKRGLYSLGFNADVKMGEFDEDRSD